jgi:acyl carrier protein
MSDAEILDALKEILQKRMRVDRPIEPPVRVLHDLELDSLQRIALVIEVENRFQVCLEPEDEQAIETIADLIRVIGERQQSVGAEGG